MGRSIASGGGAGGERKAPCIASLKDNFAARDSPLAGLDAPTLAREKGLQPYGTLYCSGGDPKGCRGRSESPLLFCRNIYTLLVFSPTRPEGGQGGRAESPLHCIAKRQLCRKRFPFDGA